MLDEFRYHHHVLSADEILQLANNTAPQGDNSLLAYLLDKAAKVNTDLYKRGERTGASVGSIESAICLQQCGCCPS